MGELPDNYDDWKTRAPEDEPGYRDPGDVPCWVDDQRDDDDAPQKCQRCQGYCCEIHRADTGELLCPKCSHELQIAQAQRGLQEALESLKKTLDAVPPDVMARRKRQAEEAEREMARRRPAGKAKRKRNSRKYNGVSNWR